MKAHIGGVLIAASIGLGVLVSSASGSVVYATSTCGSERVYYSLTVLTTTGFGDFTAATAGGRALAVVEMVLGQLYLVTVIGVLVGDMASRRRAQ